jgi:thioesterase domain-containing protein
MSPASLQVRRVAAQETESAEPITWSAAGVAGIVPFQPTGTMPPLFCMHPAGGQVFLYRAFPAVLGPDQPVLAIQSDAVTDGGSEHMSIAAMAAAYAGRIEAVQRRGPYCLFGISFGGVVAHAVAAELERRGQAVGFLGIADASPVADTRPFFEANSWYRTEIFPRLAPLLAVGTALGALLEILSTEESEEFFEDMATAPTRDFRDRVIDRLLELGHLRSRPTEAYLRAQAALSRLHIELTRRHRDAIVAAPIHAYWPIDRRLSICRGDWRAWTNGGVVEKIVAGNHLTMCVRPHVEMVLRDVSGKLADCRASR